VEATGKLKRVAEKTSLVVCGAVPVKLLFFILKIKTIPGVADVFFFSKINKLYEN
jgi:hypothetical protein